MPLIKQRFREMFRQAQHDRKLFCFVLLIDLYARFLFVGATGGRPLSVITNKTFFLTPRHSNKALCTPHPHCHSKRFLCQPSCVIPSEVEESRGNERGDPANNRTGILNYNKYCKFFTKKPQKSYVFALKNT